MSNKKNKLEGWINIPVILDTENYGSIEGTIKNEKPYYLFVNDDEHGVKIKLLSYKIEGGIITGFGGDFEIGKDSEIFKYTIKKKN